MSTNRRRVITRNFVNDAKFNASKFPRSGFNLGYQTKMTGMIGRVWIPTYQHLQPKDSFSGNMAGSFTFNKLVTPLAPELNTHVYVFQCRHRSVDADYEETMNPNEINSYGNGLHFPMFRPDLLCSTLLNMSCTNFGLDTPASLCTLVRAYVEGDLTTWTTYLSTKLSVTNDATWNAYKAEIVLPYDSAVQQDMERAFRDDYRSDLVAYVKSFLPDSFTAVNTLEGLYSFLRAILAWPMQIWGQDSFADQFGYPVMRLLPLHTKRSCSTAITTTTLLAQWFMYDGNVWTRPMGADSTISSDPLYCNEYPFRHLLSIWVEYLRNVHLEKRASWMKYRNLNSTSVLNKMCVSSSYSSVPQDDRVRFWAMLAPLSAYYAEDLVTSAQTDAAFKHVFAPIMTTNSDSTAAYVAKVKQTISPASTSATNNDLLHNSLCQALIKYENSDGTITSVNCPIPANVNSFLMTAYGTSAVGGANLHVQDFGVVRTMHNVENYLKRKYFFGDEYQDEMLAQHDVSLSDTALLKPKLIAGGTNLISDSQMVSTNGADPAGGSASVADIGTRVAKQEGQLPNVNYNGFADENGMLISLAWILPTAHYDPSCVQNYAKGYLDFPLPVMASSNETIINNVDFSRTQNYIKPFGHAPYMVHWRTRLNEIHGDFLDTKVDWFCNRFFANGTQTPVLQYRTLRTSGLTLGMYQDSLLFDGQWWLLATHQFHVMRQLPANVEYA